MSKLADSGGIDFMAMLRNARKEAQLSKLSIPTVECNNNSKTHELSLKSMIFKTDVYNLSAIDSLLLKFQNSQETEWLAVGGRDVAIFGGVPHPSGAILEKLPPWLAPIADHLKPFFEGNAPNQVLLNRYDENQGIQFHNDGPLYLSTAAILSFSNDALLEFRPNKAPITSLTDDINTPFHPEMYSVYLPSNSLFVFSDSAYHHYEHGIRSDMCNILINEHCLNAKVMNISVGDIISKKSKCKRYSLTFRYVKNVAKVLEEFGPCNEEERSEIKRRLNWWLQSITDQ